MEQALRSAFGSKQIWEITPSEPAAGDDDLKTYHDATKLLLDFTSLWNRSPYFLAANSALHSISTDLASRAYMTLVVYRDERPSPEQTAKLRELWEGPVDEHRPIAGLLENYHWRSTAHRPDGTLRCSKSGQNRVATSADPVCLPTGDIIEERIRHVYRRLVTARRLPLSRDEFKACAIVWLAYDRGTHNLPRWQRAVVSFLAHFACSEFEPRDLERHRCTRSQRRLTVARVFQTPAGRSKGS